MPITMQIAIKIMESLLKYLLLSKLKIHLLITSIYFRGIKRPGDVKTGGLGKDMKGAAALESGKACRICLDDTEEEGNPFITPCKCAGSMKFIHLQCLREW